MFARPQPLSWSNEPKCFVHSHVLSPCIFPVHTLRFSCDEMSHYVPCAAYFPFMHMILFISIQSVVEVHYHEDTTQKLQGWWEYVQFVKKARHMHAHAHWKLWPSSVVLAKTSSFDGPSFSVCLSPPFCVLVLLFVLGAHACAGTRGLAVKHKAGAN